MLYVGLAANIAALWIGFIFVRRELRATRKLIRELWADIAPVCLWMNGPSSPSTAPEMDEPAWRGNWFMSKSKLDPRGGYSGENPLTVKRSSRKGVELTDFPKSKPRTF